MKRVIIFGVKDFAELANYYLESDSDFEVACFTVNRDFLPENREFCGKPIVSFGTIQQEYPPTEYLLFAPMSPSNGNRDRQKVYENGLSMGYEYISYISSRAYTGNAVIGDNCFILEDNTIQPFVTIGNNVVMWSGNHIGHHSTIEDHVFFTSQVVLSGHCEVGRNSFFGVNATIRDGLRIAPYSFVGMASTILNDTERGGKYVGSPAKLKGLTSVE